ncbi:MAG: HRDC domain-containing protein, partial [Clostridiales bacterium]|nr:HRDC domain-containing protein [Clostridiales bacterium]
DKSNVSYVIHYNMPKSLEAYYQEAGRAGRDGERAECILLFSPGDIRTARFLIDNSHDNEELTPRERAEARRRDYDRLDAMTAYCRTRDCLRGVILDYFGQPHSPRCGTCGNCLEGYELTDITSQAQMILSCIERIRVKLGYCVGPVLVSRVLRGSRDKRVLELGLDTVTTYGLMRETPGARVKEYLDYLEAQGYTRVDPDHGALRITPAARGVLFHGERVSMPLPRETKTAERVRRARGEAEPLTGEEERLFTTLKDLRYRLAQKEGVPPFVIFSNASLRDMAVRKPRSMAAFLQVSGVGETKARKYGPAFLPAIQGQEESAR